MAKKYTDEFRADAVRMATTSGLTRPQLSSDLGVGVSTLNKWVQQHPLPGRVLCSNIPRGSTTI
jgi:transposase